MPFVLMSFANPRNKEKCIFDEIPNGIRNERNILFNKKKTYWERRSFEVFIKIFKSRLTVFRLANRILRLGTRLLLITVEKFSVFITHLRNVSSTIFSPNFSNYNEMQFTRNIISNNKRTNESCQIFDDHPQSKMSPDLKLM